MHDHNDKDLPILATTHVRTLLQLCLLTWDRLASTLLSMFSLTRVLIACDLPLRRLILVSRDLVIVARMSLVNDNLSAIDSLV